jgi:WD40 repeat protein
VDIWQTATGQHLQALRLAAVEEPMYLAYSPDGHTLATGVNGTVALWDVSSGRSVTSLPNLGRWTFGLTFDPSGRFLVIGALGDVFLWDTATGTMSTLVLDRRVGVLQVAVSPDGRTLAALTSDHRVELWHLPTGREMFTLLHAPCPLAWLQFNTADTLSVGTAPDEQGASGVYVFAGRSD